MELGRKGVGWGELLLLASSLTFGLLIAEFAVRYLPAGDQMGWSMVPSVADRVAAVVPKKEKTRILALGDSFTEWRDNTGDSFVRVAGRLLPEVEMVNLAESDGGLGDYFGNLLRYGNQLRPDVVLIGLYLGNDPVPSSPALNTGEARVVALTSQRPREENWWKRSAKHSVLLNYIFRLSKIYFPVLRSGFFEQMIDELRAQTGKDEAYIARRLSQADPNLVDAAQADAING